MSMDDSPFHSAGVKVRDAGRNDGTTFVGILTGLKTAYLASRSDVVGESGYHLTCESVARVLRLATSVAESGLGRDQTSTRCQLLIRMPIRHHHGPPIRISIQGSC